MEIEEIPLLPQTVPVDPESEEWYEIERRHADSQLRFTRAVGPDPEDPTQSFMFNLQETFPCYEGIEYLTREQVHFLHHPTISEMISAYNLPFATFAKPAGVMVNEQGLPVLGLDIRPGIGSTGLLARLECIVNTEARCVQDYDHMTKDAIYLVDLPGGAIRLRFYQE